jgi:hypothetical protein
MKRLRHASRRWIAIALARVPLHHIATREHNQQIQIIKRRSLVGRLLIGPGNLYLRWLGAVSVVLPESEWHRWEQTVAAATIESNNVVTLKYPGVTLANILKSTSIKVSQKVNSVTLALQSLIHLHSRTTVLFENDAWQFSHGDATVENVCIDRDNQVAHWFDFDMRHRQHLTTAQRHNDDLRTLLFSAAACLPPESFPDLSQRCLKIMSAKASASFRAFLKTSGSSTIFQLAQAPLTFQAESAFRTAIMGFRFNLVSGTSDPCEQHT